MVLLAIALVTPGSLKAAAAPDDGAKSNDDFKTYETIAPPFITPGRASFTTREGESFVVVITATCLLSDDSDTQFELLPATPGFVHVSSAYRRVSSRNEYTEGLGVVEVSPHIGDAGKHIVTIRVKSCSGKVERVISFKVRVKQSEP